MIAAAMCMQALNCVTFLDHELRSNREFGLGGGGGLVGRRRVKLAIAGLYLSATALHLVYLRYVKLRLSGPTLTSER